MHVIFATKEYYMRVSAPLILALSLASAMPALAQTAFDGPYIGAMVGLQAHSQNRVLTEGTAGFLGLPSSVRPDFQDLRFEDGWQGSVTARLIRRGHFVSVPVTRRQLPVALVSSSRAAARRGD
jgi:hypothetical protein